MTIREAKRVLFLRMSQDPVSAQEKAGLEFAFGIMDMIDEKNPCLSVLSEIETKNTPDKDHKEAAGETDKSDNTETSTNEAAGEKVKRRKRAPVKRTCQECGKDFMGYATTKYCTDCKKKVKSRKTKESNERRKTQKALDEMEETRRMAEQLAAM